MLLRFSNNAVVFSPYSQICFLKRCSFCSSRHKFRNATIKMEDDLSPIADSFNLWVITEPINVPFAMVNPAFL